MRVHTVSVEVKRMTPQTRAILTLVRLNVVSVNFSVSGAMFHTVNCCKERVCSGKNASRPFAS